MNEGPVSAPARPRCGRRVAVVFVVIAAAVTGLWGWNRAGSARHLRADLQQAAAAGRWAQVAVLARRLTELDPADGEAWLLAARAEQGQGNPAASARLLSQMPAENEQKFRALRGLVELQLGPLNSPRDAERTLREMLQRDPRSEFAHQRLIFFYALTLQRQELVRQARQAMELECEPTEAYVYLFFADSLHFSNGPEMNQRWLAGNPDSELFRVAAAIHIATALEGGPLRDDLSTVREVRRMMDNRERVLAELLKRYPQNLELLAWHIDRAIRQGDIDRAIELLGKLPSEADSDNRFLRFAGWAQAQLGHDEAALSYYDQALEKHPLDWNTRHLIAELRRRQLNFDEVERMEKLVRVADDLRRELDVVPDANSAQPELLTKLAAYAEQCGDELFAKSLHRHLNSLSRAPAGGG
jgi:tetratricopeptide (TPR) repeat protein